MSLSKEQKKRIKKLSIFAVAMITISSVDSIRNLPASAKLGSQSIFYFALAAICYFIPIALVCAELSTTYPEKGGVYLWGKKTIGQHFGFLSLWFQFAENLVFYPPLLVFIIATAIYPFSHDASHNSLVMFVSINAVFWLITLVNIFGLKISALFSEVFGLLGTVFPMILICCVGFYWYFDLHNTSNLVFSWNSIIPDFHHLNIGVTFTSVILSLTGIEIATVYANEVKNPQKSYPIALIIATVFIITTLTLGSLAISAVIGPESATLDQGIMTFFSHFFTEINIPWLIPVIAFCIVAGGLAGLNNWIIAPIKGLSAAAEDGYMPHILKHENKYSAPVPLLIVQGIVVSLLSLIFLFIPTVNEGMWFLNILMTQLYMLMYISIFISFIASRIIHKERHRPFKVPGGIIGMWFVFIFGILSSSITVLLCFRPDQALKINDHFLFGIALVTGIVLFTIPAIIGIIYQIRNTVNTSKNVHTE